MNHFLLLPNPPLVKVTAEQVDQLRSIPGACVARVMAYMVAVYFDGDQAQFDAKLAGSAWTSFYMSESRTYRLQS